MSRLAPGDQIVVVKDLAAFRSRYGNIAVVAGQSSGNLNNNYETITLTVAGTLIQQFPYQDDWYPNSDGRSSSPVSVNADLSLIDPTGGLEFWWDSWRRDRSAERGKQGWVV